MMLARSYTLIAPVYDRAVTRLLEAARRASIEHLPGDGKLTILIDGIGTGLDLPHLPHNHRYVGTDLVGAMLNRAQPRALGRECTLVQADSMALPFASESFDAVILHLILAVVAHPVAALTEAARVTRPGGSLLVMDKFLRPGQWAPVRRALSPLAARFATRLDVVFEQTLAQAPGLRIASDRPVLAGGWFRSILLEKQASR